MRTADIDRLVGSIARGAGPGLTHGARELLDEITSAPPAGVRRGPANRLARLLPLTRQWALAPLTVAVVLLTWMMPGGLGPGPRPADALEIHRSGVYFSVVVKNVFADRGTYRRELAEIGLPVSMVVVPGRPGSAGQIIVVRGGPLLFTGHSPASWHVPDSRDIAPLPTAFCRHDDCPVGMLIRAGYRGDDTIWLAREALPGEFYQFPATPSTAG